jgi:hypothetical protein
MEIYKSIITKIVGGKYVPIIIDRDGGPYIDIIRDKDYIKPLS